MERLLDERNNENAENASIPSMTFREKMWRAFENPHTGTMALVFYYVTGLNRYFIISVLYGVAEPEPPPLF